MFKEHTLESITEFVDRLSQYNLSLDINDWVRVLDSIDPYDIHPNVKYDLVMAVEYIPFDYKKIGMLQFYSNLQKQPAILTVSSVDVYDMIENSEVDQPYVPASFKKLIALACTEGSTYLQNSKSVPIDLFTKLVKLKVMLVIWKLIYAKKLEMSMLNRSEYYAPPPEEKKGGKKGDKSPKKTSSKKAKKDSTKKAKKDSKKKAKKGKDKKAETNPCLDVLNKPDAKAQVVIDDIIPDTHLYIILVGFYNPHILQYLATNGFHLSILVKFQGIISDQSLKDLTIYNESNFFRLEAKLNRSIIEQDIFTQKGNVLNHFWNKITNSYAEPYQYHLDESFIMNYTPPVFTEEITSEIYFKNAEVLYFHFLNVLNECNEFRVLHKTYVDHLKIYSLGYGSFMTVDDMLQYRTTMSTLPLPISDPPFIIEALFDEVVMREEAASRHPGLDEDTYTKIRLSRGHASATRWESMYSLPSSSLSQTISCDKIGDLYHTRAQLFADMCRKNKRKDFACHVSFTDHLKRLLEFYRKNVIEYRKENKGHLYEFVPTLDKVPFVIHESNSVDLALNYYKYIPECVKKNWLHSFEKNPYLQLCQNLPKLSDEDETVYRQQLNGWCELLGLGIDELINCIFLLCYGKMSCNQAETDDSLSSFIKQHFHTENLSHNVDSLTNIVTINPTSAQEINANHYEKITPSEFKWLEDLSPAVAIQKFYNAQKEYCCVDYKPIEILQAVLFRFHNNCDEFGLNQKKWNITLRTLASFRDFMHTMIFKDIAFVLAHKNRRKEVERFYNDILEYEKMVSKFVPDEQDFLFKDSLKILLSKPVEVEEGVPKKKGKKDAKAKGKKAKAKGKNAKTKGKNAKAKGKKSDKTSKAKSKKDLTNVEDIVEKEDFEPPITYRELAEDNKIRDHIKKLTLPALDYTAGLLTASGSTTTFCSLDNFKIVVNKYKTSRYPVYLSASFTMNENTVYVHNSFVNGFAFHINLKNGGIVSLGKLPKVIERKMRFFLVEELRNKHLPCLGGSVPKRRETIMASKWFHNTVQVPALLRKDSFNKNKLMPKMGPCRISIKSLTSKRASWMKDPKPARLIESLSNVMFYKQEQSIDLSKKLSLDEEEDIPLSFNIQDFIDDIMRFKNLLPTAKFKILSSPLHRYSYIKRKKSNIELVISDIVRYILGIYKNKLKYMRVKNVYDLDTETEKKEDFVQEATIAFRITLPSGLHIKNIHYVNETYIIQKYLSKEPQNIEVVDEKYRMFLKDGISTIRKVNGDFFVYQANGDIVHYEIPLNKKNWSPFYLFKKKDNNKKNVETLLESIHRRVKRLNKNILEDYECKHTVSRTSGGFRRKQFKCKKAFLLKELKFTVITCDGRRVYYHNGNITEEMGYRCDKQEQIELYQVVFKRSDGTVSIFNKSGVLETTFPDGTRISSWTEADPELVNLDLRKRLGVKVKMPAFMKANMYYQYEHPKYACVTFDGANNEMKFKVPGDVQLQASPSSCSVITGSKTLIRFDEEKIIMESMPCEECKKYNICKINSKPLFFNKHALADDTFFKARDPYDKLIMCSFDGNIRRNTDYSKEEILCTSILHKKYPTQKVMLIFSDLRAKYLWSEKMYINRMADAIKSENTQLVLYVNDKNLQVDTTEIRVYEPDFYNGNFRMAYLPSMVVNNDVKPTFRLDQAACMKQRLLFSVSISNLSDLLNFVRKEDCLTSKDGVNAFLNFIVSCQESDVATEDFSEVIKPKSHLHAAFSAKIKAYKEILAENYRRVLIAKDKKNLIPYFQRQLESKKSNKRQVVQNSEGKFVEVELFSERSGESNRSEAGSALETVTRTTSMSDETYDLIEHINTDKDVARIYERTDSYAMSLRDDSEFIQNMFSISTVDELVVTPILTREDRKAVSEETDCPKEKNFKRPESRLRFAEDPKEKHSDDPVAYFPKIEMCVPFDESEEASVEFPIESSKGKKSCMQELQDSLKNLVLQGTLEEDCAVSSPSVEGNLAAASVFYETADMESTNENQISRKIEKLFNVPRKEPVKLPSEEDAQMSSREDHISEESDSLIFEVGSAIGRDYVTSPSLQTVTSQMLRPTTFQEFTHFEITELLKAAGVTPLMYHEISEIDLVKQLVGLASARPVQTEITAQEPEIPQYEAMICKRKTRDDDDLLGSDDEKIGSTSSSASNAVDECTEIIAGHEEVTVEEEIEEEEVTSSSGDSLKSLHKEPRRSDDSIRASVFDFGISYPDEKDLVRDPSMIPLLNEKSLLRAIKKDLKRAAEEPSAYHIHTRPGQKLSIDISSSSTSNDMFPGYYSSASSEKRTTSTSNTTRSLSLPSTVLPDRWSDQSPTPVSTGVQEINPSMVVFRDPLSFNAKFINILVESVGVSTTAKNEAEVGTDLSYGENDSNDD